MAFERDVEKTLEAHVLEINDVSLQFDENSEILVYSTFVGVKYYSMTKKRVVQLQGKNESSERFLKFCLYQGRPMKSPINSGGSQKIMADPLLVATAFRKNRFYIFSGREPEGQTEKSISRDIFNERPSKEEQNFAQ